MDKSDILGSNKGRYGQIRAIKGKYAQIRVIKPKYSQIWVNSGKYRQKAKYGQKWYFGAK